MLQEFDLLVRQRKALKEWWNLGVNVATYRNRYHTLRVDVQKPEMVAFCGQQYAGAQNYHDAPPFFVEAIRQEIAEQSPRIVEQTYEKELARLDAEIEKHRAAVLQQLAAA